MSHPYEEVDHEKDVEGEVDLLGGVLHPGDALLHPLGRGVDEVDAKGGDGEDEDHRDEDLPHPCLRGDQLSGPVLCL